MSDSENKEKEQQVDLEKEEHSRIEAAEKKMASETPPEELAETPRADKESGPEDGEAAAPADFEASSLEVAPSDVEDESCSVENFPEPDEVPGSSTTEDLFLPSYARIMISAGESSGEMHGAALMRAAKARGLKWEFIGLGGDRMTVEGARLLGHIKDTSVMGITEVLGSLRRILSIRSAMKHALETERPDALVLIDAPDFNFALARHAHSLGIPVIYYICPQVWAWRESRLKFLAKYTSRRALLFKFEKEFYEERGVTADWVGHPICDDLPSSQRHDEIKKELGFSPKKRLLAVLPGSRRKVIERLAPVFLDTANLLMNKDPELELVLPLADSIDPDVVRRFLDKASFRVRERLKIIPGVSREILAVSDLAIVASGTSSVEATFLGTPMVVAYQVSRLSWAIGRRLVSVPFVSIANLVAGREIVPEFLQEKVNPENIAVAAWPYLAGGFARAKMIDDLISVRSELGGPGASDRVVDIIAEEIGQRSRQK